MSVNYLYILSKAFKSIHKYKSLSTILREWLILFNGKKLILFQVKDFCIVHINFDCDAFNCQLSVRGTFRKR